MNPEAAPTDRIIPILAHGPQAVPGHGCQDCVASAAGPVCPDELGPRCDEPRLMGSAERLSHTWAQLEAALSVQVPGGLRASGLVHALEVGEDEATLVIAVSPRCGGALLADAAFQALRLALPDTDIYVQHVR